VLPFLWSGASVLTFHDDYLLTRRSDYDVVKRWLLPPIFRRSVRRAGVVALLTASVAESARALAGSDSVLVETGAAMSTNMASAVASCPTEFPSGLRYALVVGDAGRRKRVGRLVDVWQQLGSDLSLVVAGGRAATPELVAQIARADRVRLVRAPTDGELAWLYRHADLVIDASDEEGFGFPRVEAAAFGTPYVAIREAHLADVDASWVAYLRDRIDDISMEAGGERTHGDTTDRWLVTWDDVAEVTAAAYRTALEVSGPGEAGRMGR
jgi:glycosyltransferase involved in cell wall biosynthesis